MSFWSRLFSLPAPIAVPAGESHRPYAASQDAGGGIIISTPDQLARYLQHGDATASGARVTPHTALTVAACYRCSAIIAGAIATMPLPVKKRVDKRTREDADDHWLWPLLNRRPNRWQTPSEFRRMLQTHVNFRGNAYALKVGRTNGRTVELQPLNPDRMKVEQDSQLNLTYRYHLKAGGTVVFSQGDVLHLRGLTLDGVTGVSVLTYAREAIALALQTEKHGAALFKNGASIGLSLETDKRLGKEAVDNLKQSLDEYRGADNAHKSLILEEGLKAKNVGMTSEDAQFLETRKFQRGDIAMFFGVPPHMIGDTEKSTSWGTGIEQQSIGFVTYTLEDWLTMWEEAINRDLVPESEPAIYAKFNRSALLKGDTRSRWESYVKALQWGVLNANEVRALEDMNPREGGDEYYPPPNTAGGEGDAEEKARRDLDEDRPPKD